ncbi:MAG TPA: site-2 protease family protein [Candidatus Obscuribacter sp.]|nr:site-2 protease family protein [Candidatus Obscuribacter sp.]HMY54071.1 site-2 protease family protein [Candidatus Obscuribacter sp.]HNB14375.1 site-2 protease family protein [Candidatus Obscuribacter sp.]HND65740.1 site-2 protease family protein [Candidatus Obscuribacter sp.]
MFRLFTFPLLLAAFGLSGGAAYVQDMFAGMGSLPSIIGMILGLCLLITIHELGHWLVARLCGMQTPVFSIGFGKREWSLVLGKFWETEFRIAPILAGGYVSIPELLDETSLNEAAKDGDLPKNLRVFPVWQRIAVAAAGVTFNMISAVLMVFVLFTFWGQPDYKVNSTYIRDLSTQVTVARDAGLQPKDQFVSVDGRQVVSPDDLSAALKANKEKPVQVVVKRGSGDVTVTVTPTKDGTIGIVLGANAERIYKEMSVGDAAVNSVKVTGKVLDMTFKGFGMMLGLVEKPANISDADMEVRGIVGIVQMGAGALGTGAFDFIWFLMVISINLAVMNILPIPVLDGGHIVFFLIEGVTGKPVNPRTKALLSNIFVMLLLALFALGLFNDLKHIVGG